MDADGLLLKPSFYMITHDRRIAENVASDRQQSYGLYVVVVVVVVGNTFQRLDDRQRSSAIIWKHFLSDRRRSSAILLFSDSSDPAIVSDHMETRLYRLVVHFIDTASGHQSVAQGLQFQAFYPLYVTLRRLF